jgi:hypothetical protein
MIECTRFSERCDNTWLPGAILFDHRGWTLGGSEPYAKVMRWGSSTWSALVVDHRGERSHLMGYGLGARDVYSWASSKLRRSLAIGRRLAGPASRW